MNEPHADDCEVCRDGFGDHLMNAFLEAWGEDLYAREQQEAAGECVGEPDGEVLPE